MSAPQLWWEVWFIERDHRPWLRLKPGFGHCLMLGYQPMAMTWTLIDYRGPQLDIYGLLPEQAEAVREYCRRREGKCLVARQHEDVFKVGAAFGPLTCVTIARRVLGVRGIGIWTPWQLYKALFYRGDVYLLEGDEDEEALWWRRRWWCGGQRREAEGNPREAGG